MTTNINEEDVFLFSRSQTIVESDLIPAGQGDNYDEIMKSLYEQHAEAVKKRKALESAKSLLNHK